MDETNKDQQQDKRGNNKTINSTNCDNHDDDDDDDDDEMDDILKDITLKSAEFIQRGIIDVICRLIPIAYKENVIKVASHFHQKVKINEFSRHAGDLQCKAPISVFRFLKNIAGSNNNKKKDKKKKTKGEKSKNDNNVNTNNNNCDNQSNVVNNSDSKHVNRNEDKNNDDQKIPNHLALCEKGGLKISTYSVVGTLLLREYLTPMEFATAIINELPSDLVNRFISDIRINKGCIIFTTHQHMFLQLRRERLHCPSCGLFFKGERGIRDHQLVKHQSTYSISKSIAEESKLAIVQFWRTGNEMDSHVVKAILNQVENENLNLAESRKLHPGLEACKEGKLCQLKEIIASGWNPSDENSCDRNGSTAFMWCSGGGFLEICTYLVEECQVDPCARQPKDGRCALHFAARNGHLSVCEYLVQVCKIDPNIKMIDGTTPFMYAVFHKNIHVVDWFFNVAKVDIHSLNIHGCNATQWAALSGDVNMCQWLKDKGVDFSLLNYNGHSVLHKASVKGNLKICQWLLEQYDETDIDSKKELMGKDIDGHRPSELAKLEGFRETANWLIEQERRCDINHEQEIAARGNDSISLEKVVFEEID